MIRNNKLISENRSVSNMSIYWASITTVEPDRDRIPCKNENRNFQKFQSQGIK